MTSKYSRFLFFLFSFLLTLSVGNYLYIDLINDEKVAFELELEKNESELKEKNNKENKGFDFTHFWSHQIATICPDSNNEFILSSSLKLGNGSAPAGLFEGAIPIPILYHQLKLDC